MKLMFTFVAHVNFISEEMPTLDCEVEVAYSSTLSQKKPCEMSPDSYILERNYYCQIENFSLSHNVFDGV